jgi:hypothetical protein
LSTQLDDDFSQILAIVDGAGREIETVTFPQGRPIEARWADEVAPPGERPPILVWWRDESGDERRLILWTRDSITEWLREKDAGAAGAVAMVRGSIDLLDGPREGARLMRLAGPETTPIEVLPGPLEDFAVAPGGDRLVAVRAEGGGRSLWILEIGTAPPGS